MDMSTSLRTSWILQECRQKWFFLALCATLSAGFGVLFANFADDSYVLLMRMAAGRHVSIVGFAVAYFLPYLVSFLLIVHSKPWLVYFICGIRIFCFSSISSSLVISFGTAGWLVRLLMLFPDICLLPIMMWLSHASLMGHRSHRSLMISIILILVVGMIYFSMISPFGANLIDSYETMGRYAIHVGLDWRL